MTLSRFWSKGEDTGDRKAYGFDTVVKNSISDEQFQVYTNLVRIQEIDQCVYNGKYIEWSAMEPINGFEREPEPIYDFKGKRINTREILLKKKLENERNELIKVVLNKLPQYKAPNNYNPEVKIVEKLFLNVHEHPDINFMGLLLGPRGNTLKKLQQESGAKIGIRGKGSVKGGRSNNSSGGNGGTMNGGNGANNLDEDLHCLIIADSQSKVDLAKKLCLQVIDEVISAPEGQNEHKRNQLRELALLNGTFRESIVICSNCGENGHRKYQCPNSQLANQFKCVKCGGIGHLEKDCIKGNGNAIGSNNSNEMDDEFSEFMKELGENTTTTKNDHVNELKRPLENEYEGETEKNNSYNNNYNNNYSSTYNNNKRHYKSYDQNGFNNNNYNYYDYNNGGYKSNYNHGNDGTYYGYGYKNQQNYNRGYNSYSNTSQQMSYGASKSPFSNAPSYSDSNAVKHNGISSGISGNNNKITADYSQGYKPNANRTSNKLPPPPPPSMKPPPISSLPLRKNNLPPPPPPPPPPKR